MAHRGHERADGGRVADGGGGYARAQDAKQDEIGIRVARDHQTLEAPAINQSYGRPRAAHHMSVGHHAPGRPYDWRSEEHTSELQSLTNLVCRLLLEKKKTQTQKQHIHKQQKSLSQMLQATLHD